MKIKIENADKKFYKILPLLLKSFNPEQIIYKDNYDLCPGCRKKFKLIKIDLCQNCFEEHYGEFFKTFQR